MLLLLWYYFQLIFKSTKKLRTFFLLPGSELTLPSAVNYLNKRWQGTCILNIIAVWIIQHLCQKQWNMNAIVQCSKISEVCVLLAHYKIAVNSKVSVTYTLNNGISWNLHALLKKLHVSVQQADLDLPFHDYVLDHFQTVASEWMIH